MIEGMQDFKDDIAWDVHKAQQQAPKASPKQAPMSMADMNAHEGMDVPLGQKPQGEMVDTFLGRMPRHMPSLDDPNSPEYRKQIDEMIGWAAGGPGMKVIGEAAPMVKAAISKGADYLNPGKAAEQFRGTLGSGTTKETVDELGKRTQFAKGSAKEEALIPKRELYSQEGQSDVFKVKPDALPEGNIPKMAEMIAPGEKYGESEAKALSKAIADYRKTGSIENFAEKSEDIFGIPELPEKALSKVEDALLMPTKRESAYFSEEGVTDYYGKKGLNTLHNQFESKPTLANYDALQSAIKKEIRKLSSKGKSLDSAGEEKLSALQTNVKNLDRDKEAFMKTLPDEMQSLENEFRTKYAQGVGKYESAPLTMRKLAEGRSSEVTGAQVAKLFTNPTKETIKILQDLGPSAGKNVLYLALQKVPLNDAEGMAKTILDLKRTKGYDQFIDAHMEQWANNMLKHVRNAAYLKGAMKAGGGFAAGTAFAGPIGGAIGAAAPFIAPAMKDYGGKILSKVLKK